MIFATPQDFDFLTAVCSHGFFVLAPNVWDPARRRLHTVVTIDGSTAVLVEVGQAKGGGVELRLPAGASKRERAAATIAIRRMLRLDEDLSAFHERCRESRTHTAAAEVRFGRLLRSASLFEDIVKVICTCNTSWRQTTSMVAALVAHWGVPTRGAAIPAAARQLETGATRGLETGATRGLDTGAALGFPTPARLAAASVLELRSLGRLGYRAAFVHQLAREVTDGRVDLDSIERYAGPSDERYRMLRCIRGVGDYAAGHLLMLLGRYERLAIDTELLRHLRQRYPRRRWTPALIRAHYAKWHPYQFLAYWFELWQGYAARHGRPEAWHPDNIGRKITQTR